MVEGMKWWKTTKRTQNIKSPHQHNTNHMHRTKNVEQINNLYGFGAVVLRPLCALNEGKITMMSLFWTMNCRNMLLCSITQAIQNNRNQRTHTIPSLAAMHVIPHIPFQNCDFQFEFSDSNTVVYGSVAYFAFVSVSYRQQVIGTWGHVTINGVSCMQRIRTYA